MIRKSALAAFACLLGLTAAGCSPQFQALTTPPPFTEAELCDGAWDCGGHKSITVSKGIALAFECLTSEAEPCSNVEGLVDDPDVATVYEGYVTSLSAALHDDSLGTVGAQPRSALVIVGHGPGHTKMKIKSDDGDAEFDVIVHDL